MRMLQVEISLSKLKEKIKTLFNHVPIEPPQFSDPSTSRDTMRDLGVTLESKIKNWLKLK